MLCQACKLNPATVHVTTPEQHFSACPETGAEVYKFSAELKHLCEPCAQSLKLNVPAPKNVAEVWKLLQAAQVPRAKRESGGLACPECGMTLRDFRQRGRLGCPKDYEVFGPQLRDILERIHGATAHVGRAPGFDEAASQRLRRITELRAALDAAIRDEAYEAAARLRDELKSLQ